MQHTKPGHAVEGTRNELDGTLWRGVSILDNNTRLSGCCRERYASAAESGARAHAHQAAMPSMYKMFRIGVQPAQAPCKSCWPDSACGSDMSQCLVRAGPAAGWQLLLGIALSSPSLTIHL
jgi:hypothetical protein